MHDVNRCVFRLGVHGLRAGEMRSHGMTNPASPAAAQRRASMVGAAGAEGGAEVQTGRVRGQVQWRGSGWVWGGRPAALVLSAVVGLGAVAGEGAPVLRGLTPVTSDAIARTGVAVVPRQLRFEAAPSKEGVEMRLRSLEDDLHVRMDVLETKVRKSKEAADESWILMSSTLVLMMTISGLALFYGGLVRVQNVLATVMQSFAIACVITVLWIAVGYSLCFTEGSPIYGGYTRYRPSPPSVRAARAPTPPLEATEGQIDGFFSQLPYKCHPHRVASVGD